MRPKSTAQDTERFWSKVDRSGGDDACWLWTGSTSKAGYGRVTWRGASHNYAHCLSWEIHNGSIPDGLHVCHDCPGGDNPGCVNQAHLWLGTHADNMADRNAKGRQAKGDRSRSRLYPGTLPRGGDHWTHTMPERKPTGDRNGSRLHPDRVPRGEAHGNAKLTRETVGAIRDAYAAGNRSLRSLADEYGLGKSHVSRIIRHLSWRE